MTSTDKPKKSAIIKAFNEGLREIGYSSDQIQQAYGYSNFLDAGQRQTVDLAAFGNAVPSLRTCNIAVSVEDHVTPERLVRLRALGAPLLFAYDLQNEQISRWRMTSDGLPAPLDLSLHIQIDRLPAYFFDNKKEWNPEAFRQARTAVFQQGISQLDFLDLGLLPTLESELQRKLSHQIQNISTQSRKILNDRDGETTFERQFSEYARLLFRLLAARLLSDRGDLPRLTQNTDVADVLTIIEKKYHDSGDTGPSLHDTVVQNHVWNSLCDGIDLRNLSPETLAFVYENTLVDRDLRRRHGIHSTPPQVASYLLRQLPIDRIPEEERVVFEPFCGNAPFLLAAMRRLRELLPVGRTPADVHQYLVNRLFGLEISPFALEIARYSLILGDYPEDNHWQIIEANAFKSAHFDNYLQQASIVLSNPPHEAFPAGTRPADAHSNQAAEALRRVLLHPPKLLGFVMPLSFVDGKAYKALRQSLVDTYSTVSMTAMPDNVFGKATQPTALIAAHQLDAQKRYFWSAVSSEDYRATFSLNGKPTYYEEKKSLPVGQDGAPILYQRAVVDVWKHLADFEELGNVAETHRGLRWAKLDGDQTSTSSAVSEIYQEGFAPGVHKVSDAIEDYVATRTLYLDIRPDRRHMNALRLTWDQPKVLVNAARISSDIWRMLALVDTEGLYASQQHLAVWPRANHVPTISVELLGAVLNGPVANAFLYHHSRGRDNDINVLERIPIPSFTSAQAEEITSLVNSYKDMRWRYLSESLPWTGNLAERGRRALVKIDVAVLEAYALPSDLESEMLQQFDGVQRRHLPFFFDRYDPKDWEAAKSELVEEREERRTSNLFANLLSQKMLVGLTVEEQNEYDLLQSQRTKNRTRSRSFLTKGQ